MNPSGARDRAVLAIDAMQRLQLDVARLVATDGDQRHAEIFHSWLHLLPFAPAGSAASPLAQLSATVSTTSGRHEWLAVGATQAMIGPCAEFFERVGAAPDAVDWLATIGPIVDPDLLGSWIETDGDHYNVGWFMRGHLDEDAALSVVDDPTVERALRAYCAQDDRIRIAAIGRSVGAGTFTGRITLDAARTNDDQAMANMVNLLGDLDVEPPRDAILATILDQAPDSGLSLVLRTIHDGVAGFGIMIDRPSLGLLAGLAAATSCGESLDRIAMLQGSVDADEASALTWYVDREGEHIDVRYDLLNDWSDEASTSDPRR